MLSFLFQKGSKVQQANYESVGERERVREFSLVGSVVDVCLKSNIMAAA